MGQPVEGDRAGNRLDVDVHRRIADSILQHCGDWSQCNDEGLTRLAAHLYALRHTPVFRRALYDLIDEPWMRARRERGDWTGAGFLADIELAWQAAFTDDAFDPVLLVRLKTAREAIRDQASRCSDELLQAMVWLDQTERAIELARLRTSTSSQLKGVLAVHEALVARGLGQPTLLEEARQLTQVLSQQTPDPFDENARALQRLAGAFAALDKMDAAHEVATSIQPRGLRIATLSRLAVAAATNSDPRADALFHEAQSLAGEIRDTGFQEMALAEVAVALAVVGRLDDARTTAASIQSAWKRAETLVRMAASLPNTAAAQAEPLFDEARNSTAALRAEPEPEFCLGQIAAAFARAGLTEDARAMGDRLPTSHREEPLHELAEALARKGLFAEASEAAGRIQGAWRSKKARQNLAGALTRAGRDTAAEELIAAMDDPHDALDEMALALAAGGRHQQALEVSRRIEAGPARVRALAGLAIALAPTEPDRARQVIEEAGAGLPHRALPPDEALIRLVAALGNVQQPEAARRLADTIPGRLQRMEAMGALAAALARWQDPEAERVLAEARQAAAGMRDDDRVEALGRLALGLAREGAFAEARAIAEHCGPGVRIQVAGAEHCQDLREGRAQADPDSIRDAACLWEAQADRVTAAVLESGEPRRFFAGLQSRSGSQTGNLNGTLEELFRWASLLRQVDPDTAPAIVREAIRVTGWFHPDWRTIYERVRLSVSW